MRTDHPQSVEIKINFRYGGNDSLEIILDPSECVKKSVGREIKLAKVYGTFII